MLMKIGNSTCTQGSKPLPATATGTFLSAKHNVAVLPYRGLEVGNCWTKADLWSAVGNTPILNIPQLADLFGLDRLLIKDESANPFGTHKDRKSAFAVRRATSCASRPDALCMITAGNAALSLSCFAATRGLATVAMVGSLRGEVIARLKKHCTSLIALDLESRRWTGDELSKLASTRFGGRVLDVSNLAAPYQRLAYEIAPHNPDILVLPVGGGELFVGLAAGLRAIGSKVRLIGVGVRRYDTIADKLYASHTPFSKALEWWTGSKHPHQLIYLDDESRLAETEQLLARYVSCEASSAVAFEALRQLCLPREQKVMVLNTGTFSQPMPLYTAWEM